MDTAASPDRTDIHHSHISNPFDVGPAQRAVIAKSLPRCGAYFFLNLLFFEADFLLFALLAFLAACAFLAFLTAWAILAA